jgi:DtxR family Mn-dependent transcriptional regulator
MGLISYRRYRHIVLTAEGQHRAHDLIRRHRLAERLLTDILKVPLDEAHDEACRLEHVVSPQLEKRISDTLGSPEACPHGHPIDVEVQDLTLPLSEAPLNVPLSIARLDDESPDIVRYLDERHLLPGVEVVIRERRPAAETVVLESDGQPHTLGLNLAASIRVYPPRRRKK